MKPRMKYKSYAEAVIKRRASMIAKYGSEEAYKAHMVEIGKIAHKRGFDDPEVVKRASKAGNQRRWGK